MARAHQKTKFRYDLILDRLSKGPATEFEIAELCGDSGDWKSVVLHATKVMKPIGKRVRSRPIKVMSKGVPVKAREYFIEDMPL